MPAVHRLDAPARERIIARIDKALSARADLLFGTVFGSFVEQESFHDVDVGIWTAGSSRSDAALELAESLSSGLGLPVDVRRLNDAPITFLFHALRGRPVAVQDELRLADLMERTARDYHDRAPLLRRATKEAFAR